MYQGKFDVCRCQWLGMEDDVEALSLVRSGMIKRWSITKLLKREVEKRVEAESLNTVRIRLKRG